MLYIYFIKTVWMAVILVNLTAVVYFILGSTANFQRSMDIVETVILVYCGLPSLLLGVVSFILILKKWSPSSISGILSVILIICCMVFLSLTLYKNVNTSGWLSENVTTDSSQITADGKYEYHLELINSLQKNSVARIYLKNRDTKEESRISLDMQVNKIKVLFMEEKFYWIVLEPTSKPNIYSMKTTSEFPLPEEQYKINIGNGEAKKIE